MHESTVSRVTANKYIATPRGTFELKYFFTTAIAGTSGEIHSAEAVRHRIRALIGAEPPADVLSDDAIVAVLRREGVDIARRTVAKYREALRHPELGAAQAGKGGAGLTASRFREVRGAMQITVSGKQVELSDALRTRVADQLEQIAGKYFDHALEAQVTFSRARSFFTCDINLHAGRGLTLARRGRGGGRARRVRRRGGTHRQAPAPLPAARQRARPRPRQPRAARGGTAIHPAARGGGAGIRGRRRQRRRAYATVIAETAADISRLSVGEAVMRMDLADQTVLMFRNSTSRRAERGLSPRTTGISAGSIPSRRQAEASGSAAGPPPMGRFATWKPCSMHRRAATISCWRIAAIATSWLAGDRHRRAIGGMDAECWRRR